MLMFDKQTNRHRGEYPSILHHDSTGAVAQSIATFVGATAERELLLCGMAQLYARIVRLLPLMC
jgi:hypothetical protein